MEKSNFDEIEFVHQLNSVDYEEWIEEMRNSENGD